MNKQTQHGEGFSTVYSIEGTPAFVDAAVAALLRSYPPQGYDTHETTRRMLDDGRVLVTLRRFNTCD